jgi:hypothetical protein
MGLRIELWFEWSRGNVLDLYLNCLGTSDWTYNHSREFKSVRFLEKASHCSISFIQESLLVGLKVHIYAYSSVYVAHVYLF